MIGPDIISIIRRYASGEPQGRIAADLGVTQSAVSKIILRGIGEALDQLERSQNGHAPGTSDPFSPNWKHEALLPNGQLVPLDPKDGPLYADGSPKATDSKGNALHVDCNLHTDFSKLVIKIVEMGKAGKAPWPDRVSLFRYLVANGILQVHAYYCEERGEMDAITSQILDLTEQVREERYKRIVMDHLAADREAVARMLREGHTKGLHAKAQKWVDNTNRVKGIEGNFWYELTIKKLLGEGFVRDALRKLMDTYGRDDRVLIQFGEWEDRYGRD